MSISDEKLSAFLDSELPEQEMQAVRDALAFDEKLADRLAEFAAVDSVVAAAYSTIDHRPLPESIKALLRDQAGTDGTESTESVGPSNVVSFPVWKRLGQLSATARGSLAVAASLVLVIGLGLTQFSGSSTSSGQPDWQQVSAALDNAPSGIERSLTDGSIKPRLTYINRVGEYCRQYQLNLESQVEQGIACREGGTWSQRVSVIEQNTGAEGDYQTASGGSALDAFLDESIGEGPFDREQERAVIEAGWR